MQWFEDLRDNIPVRWLTFGLRPSLTTLYEFRDRVAPLLEGLNRQVIQTAIAERHTDGSCGALDGTTVAANATRHRMVNLEAVERRLEILDRELAEAEQSAVVTEAADREVPVPPPVAPPPMASPPPSPSPAGVPSRTARTPRGKKRQRENCRRAREVLQAKLAANARRRKDKRKEPRKIRVALGDPTAPFGLDKLKTYRPLYNVQTMSDVQTDLVLAYETTATTADSGLLPPMVERTEAMTGRPLKEALVDSGYPSGEDLAWCKARGVTVYAPWNENSFTEGKRAAKGGPAQIPKDRFTFDASARTYRCPEGKPLTYRERSRQQRADGDYFTIEIYQADPSDCAGCPMKAGCVRGGAAGRTVRRQEHEELVEGLKSRMKEPEAEEKYRLRGCTVERRFADVKTHRGLQRFSGRTRERADAQVGLTVLAHNLITLEKLRTKREEQRKAEEMAQ